jgi:signal transduction histidine kinase
MFSLSTRLTVREFIREVALPCFLYSLIFFGASEVVENWLYNRVSEATMHLLHIIRGVASLFFVGAVLIWTLARAQQTFESRIHSVTSLLNLARFGLIAFDSDFQVMTMNLRATEMLGSIYSSNFAKWVGNVREKLLGKQDVFECASPLDDARLKILSLQSQKRGYLLMLEDITQEKTIEEQFIVAEKMSAFGRIAGGLAHETGTPLNIISGRAEIIQSLPDNFCTDCRERIKPQIDKHISVIFQQIERISGIIHQLLAQTDEKNALPRNFSVNDCVTQVVELLSPDLNREEIHLEQALGENLPDLHGHPDQIQHVVMHLLLNAIDAIQDKSGVVEIATFGRNGAVMLSVRDNGSGISRENLMRVFDPFFTTKEFGKGTGLGLSVASTLIKAHGGKIEVESQLGVGTRFVITLPVSG